MITNNYDKELEFYCIHPYNGVKYDLINDSIMVYHPQLSSFAHIPAKKTSDAFILNDTSWESWYECGKPGYDTAAIYVVENVPSSQILKKKKKVRVVRQIYLLGYKDAINLDFAISYPPTEAMKDVVMIPSYNETSR